MEINILQLLFVLMTIFIVLVGNLVNFLEEYLPAFVVQSFRYGKFSYVGKSSFKLIEVPKSWFRHFYIFSSLYSFFALYLAVDVYLYNGKPSREVLAYLDFFGGSNRSTSGACYLIHFSSIIFASLGSKNTLLNYDFFHTQKNFHQF